MPQLPISPAVPQQASASIVQPTASAAVMDAEGVDGTEGLPVLNFGAVLARQLKGIPVLLEDKGDAGLSDTPAEIGASSGNVAALATLPVDFTSLTASVLVPASPVLAGGGGSGAMPDESVSAQPLMQLPQSDEIRLAAEIAANGKNLPQAAPSEKQFADKLAVMADMPTDKSGGQLQLTDKQMALADMPTDKAGSQLQLTDKQTALAGLPTDKSSAQRQFGNDKKSPVMGVSADRLGGQLQSTDNKQTTFVNAPMEKAATQLRSADNKQMPFVDVPIDKADMPLQATGLPRHPMADVAAALRNMEPVPAQTVVPRVGSADWGTAVGDKVLWMANQNHQIAELHLNPPNLGPLEVRLSISSDQASALFVSHHSAVREAIETALPRLREMLADSGITLGNVTVGSESFSQQQPSNRQGGGENGRSGQFAIENVMSIPQVSVQGKPLGLTHDGMVDIFA